MNLKIVCPKCGAKHNPNSTHSMNTSDFIEGDIRTIMEERGWCFQCACWQNIYNVHKDNPGWVRIDGSDRTRWMECSWMRREKDVY